ncbi:Protein of unknown function DUF3295 [Fusarium oxysporum f. sp. vasinfectum]|nr:Protein of unknown function DUF3295 [Fusarium oxysporum f. sp. vasinfectum]
MPEPKSSPAAKVMHSKKPARFALGGSCSSSEQDQRPSNSKPSIPIIKNPMLQIGGSSEEDGSLKSAIASSRPGSLLSARKKQVSLSNNVMTRKIDDEASVDSDTDDYIDKSAIDDEDDSSDWEDAMEESGKSSMDDKFFQRTLSLYASTGDSLNDKSTAASRKSLEHLNYDKIRRCGEIYFQEWAPLFPALTETEFDKALDGFFDNTDPSSRNLHVTQIYLVVDIVGISSKGHGLEQLPTCKPRWQAILDAAELEPSIQTLQCFTLSLLCCIKHRDYKRLCLYMERAIGLYKNLFLHEDDKDEKHPGVAVENHKGIVWTLFILDCFSAAANDWRMELKYQDIEPTNPHKVDYPDDEASTALYLLRAAQILAQVLAEYPVSPDNRHSFSQRMEDLNSKLGNWHGRLPDRLKLGQDMKSSHPALMTITYHYILAHIHKLAFHFGKKDEHVQNFSLFQTSCKTILDLVGRLEEKDLNLPLCLNRNDLVSVCELGKNSTIVPHNAL